MTSYAPVTARRRTPAVALVWLLLVVVAQVVGAAPASAHAELERTTPASGSRLARPPAEVTLVFSEPVDLLDGGIRLLSARGRAIPTPEPTVHGSTVRWRMPADLPPGGYVVSWRVMSDDGHPVGGAFSFGVAAGAPRVTDTGALPPEPPWPVVLVRFLGYLGFAVVAGSVAVAVLCWPAAGRGGRPLRLLRGGLVLSALATVAGLLVQGPYAAGEPLTRLFDRSVVAETAHTDFAAWTQLRLFLVLAIAALVWARGSLDVTLNRWLAVMCVGAAAVTFSGTGHAAATGTLLARTTDSLHALLAGVWVGGLAVVAVALAGRPHAGDDDRHPGRPGPAALTRFSRLALVSVAGLLATGTVNAVLRLERWSDLWDSRYGVILLVKLALVATVLTVAVVSRRAVRRGAEPRRAVAAEVAVTVLVLAVTSLLASTAPP
jgi:copper transport protein